MRKRDVVLYPELSYQIIGALFDVNAAIGPGLLERTYQRAVAVALKKRGLDFREQVQYVITLHGETVGRQYLDFLIENCIVLELKQGDRFQRSNFNQINAYLKTNGCTLAILAHFGKSGVTFRRIVNSKK